MNIEQFTIQKKLYSYRLDRIVEGMKSKERWKIIDHFNSLKDIDECKKFIEQMEHSLGLS